MLKIHLSLSVWLCLSLLLLASVYNNLNKLCSRKSNFKMLWIFKNLPNENLNPPDGLFSLSLTHFRLLVSLGHDITKSGSSDSSGELLCAPSTPFNSFFLLTLLVLPPVKDSPADLTRVTLHHVRALTFVAKEIVSLK